MSILRKVVAGVALVAVAAVAGIGAIALTRPAEAAVSTVDSLHAGRGGFCGQAGLEAAAQALGLTATDLQNQLRAGESLADVADAHGADLQTVLDAVTAACVQATKDALAQAVTDGALTQDKADWLNEGLDKGYWGPGSSDGGFGMGFGGPRGFEFGGPGGGFGFGGHGHGRFGIGPAPTPAPTS
jgi:hypothetical protein